MIRGGSLVIGALALASLPELALAEPAAAPAVAEPMLALRDDGDHVIVEVRGVLPSAATPRWVHGKLAVAIDGPPASLDARSFADPTIKRVAVIGGDVPRVIAMFRCGDRLAARLTAASTIERTADGLVLRIPRRDAPAAAATIEPIAAPAAPEPIAEAPAPAAVVPSPAEAAPEPAIELPVASAPEATDDSDLAIGSATEAPAGAWVSALTSVALLAACGAALWWARRRKLAVVGPARRFEILGNQALGGKTRLVMVGLGDRRLLLAVSDAATTVVDRWLDIGGDAAADAIGLGIEPAPDPGTLSALQLADVPPLSGEPPWVADARDGGVHRRRDTREAAADVDVDSSAVAGLLELRRRDRDAVRASGEAGRPR